VVFGDQNDITDASGFRGLNPLIGVDVLRVEDAWRRRTIPPFAIQKCVGAEMNDGAHFHVLPCDLLGRWFHIDEVLRAR